jgi:hypothetical protein
MKPRSIASALLGVLLMSAAVFSQSQNGTITGVITDEAGNTIPGVTVTAVESKDSERGVAGARRAMTDMSGKYTLANVSQGNYTVSATLKGFETQSFPNVSLQGADLVRLNFKLKIAPQR